MVVNGAIDQHNTVAGRIYVQGEMVEVASGCILPLSLLLNELCTNATKYGALSKEGGKVSVSWETDADGKVLTLRWGESEGPVVTEPGTKSWAQGLINLAFPGSSEAPELYPLLLREQL